MQIKKLLPALMVVFTLALAACSTPAATSTSIGGGTLPASTSVGTMESTLPETTTVGTEPSMTGTVGTPSGTEVLPPTGSTDPGRVSNMLQFGVYNQNNEQIGNVDDLVVDFNLASLSYVIVKNTSGALIPVPWDALTLVTGGAETQTTNGSANTFVLNVDQSVFDGAPTIDLSIFPQFGAEAGNWDSDISAYWQSNMSGTGTTTPETTPMSTEMSTEAPTEMSTGASTEMPTEMPTEMATLPATEAATMPSSTEVATMPSSTEVGTMPASTGTGAPAQTGLVGVALASQLIGQSIQLPGANLTLSVSDIIVDVQTGAIQYLVISLTVGGGTASLVPVPLKDFSWDTSTSSLSLSLSASDLQSAPSFSPDAFPNTQQPGWDSSFGSYWSSLPTS